MQCTFYFTESLLLFNERPSELGDDSAAAARPGTPVLDLKPYVPYCDSFPDARAGWVDAVEDRERADVVAHPNGAPM
jgi:hypothetical protein